MIEWYELGSGLDLMGLASFEVDGFGATCSFGIWMSLWVFESLNWFIIKLPRYLIWMSRPSYNYKNKPKIILESLASVESGD